VIQLIVVSLGGGKVVTEEASVDQAISDAGKYLGPDVRDVRNVKIVKDHRLWRRWRSRTEWFDDTPPGALGQPVLPDRE
jgi:hypothetical protein